MAYGDKDWGWHPQAKVHLEKYKDAISEVCKRVTRDDDGIYYEVRITVRGLSGYEEGEDQFSLWSGRVDFGKTAGTRAGGSMFRQAARAQDQAGTEIWAWVKGQKKEVPCGR